MNTYHFKREFRRALTGLVMYAVLRDYTSLSSVMADCLERVDRVCDDYDELAHKHDESVSESSEVDFED